MNDVATLIRDGKIEQAETTLNQRKADTANWHFHRGLVLEAQGRIEDAMDAYEVAVERDGEHEAATFRLAFNHDLYGDEDRGHRAVRDARPAPHRSTSTP